MNGRHLETLEVARGRRPPENQREAGASPAANADAGEGPSAGEDERLIVLRSRMVQCRREIVLAARTRVCGATARPSGRGEARTHEPDAIAQIIEFDATHGKQVTVEKVVALHTSRDAAISEPSGAALEQLANADAFDAILREHGLAWRMLWDACDIEIESRVDAGEKLKLHLHIFHLLQTVSVHSVDLDTGMPPRGWHGEAYRGHVMWDELFIFPYLNLHRPTLTRALLLYRYRRLDEARRAAQRGGSSRRDVPLAERQQRTRGDPEGPPEPALGAVDPGQLAPPAAHRRRDRAEHLELLRSHRGPRVPLCLRRRDAVRDRALLGQPRELRRGLGPLRDPRRDGPRRVPHRVPGQGPDDRGRHRQQRIHQRDGVVVSDAGAGRTRPAAAEPPRGAAREARPRRRRARALGRREPPSGRSLLRRRHHRPVRGLRRPRGVRLGRLPRRSTATSTDSTGSSSRRATTRTATRSRSRPTC